MDDGSCLKLDIFRLGFSSQSGGIELWLVEVLEEDEEDELFSPDASEDAEDMGPFSSGLFVCFELLSELAEARKRWNRGCLDGSLHCHPTLASNRRLLRCGNTEVPEICQ